MLCPEGTDPVEVVSGDCEGEQDGGLGPSHYTQEAATEVDERIHDGGVDGLDDLPTTHGDPPRGRARQQPLPQRQLGGLDREDAVAAPVGVEVLERRGPRSAHGLGDLAAAEQSRTEGAAPAGGAVGVRAGVADVAPPGPAVERGLVGEDLGLARTTGRHRQVDQLVGEVLGVQRAVDESSAGEGLLGTLVGDGPERGLDAGLGERPLGGVGTTVGVAGIPHDLVERLAGLLGGDEVADDGVGSVGSGGDEVEVGDDPGDLGTEGRLVDAVGPLDRARLDDEMKLVAHVRAGRPGVGGGAVPGSGVSVNGVDLPAVGSDAEDLGGAGTASGLRGRHQVHVELPRRRLLSPGQRAAHPGDTERRHRLRYGLVNEGNLG